MKPPKLLYVGPFDFEVKYPSVKDTLGETFADDGLIEIRSTQSAANMRDTMLHEALHAIFFHSGMTQGMTRDDEERIIVTISPWILQLLRENPALVRFLLKDSDKAEAA